MVARQMQNDAALQIDFFKRRVTDDFAFALDRKRPQREVTERDNRVSTSPKLLKSVLLIPG